LLEKQKDLRWRVTKGPHMGERKWPGKDTERGGLPSHLGERGSEKKKINSLGYEEKGGQRVKGLEAMK